MGYDAYQGKVGMTFIDHMHFTCICIYFSDITQKLQHNIDIKFMFLWMSNLKQ